MLSDSQVRVLEDSSSRGMIRILPTPPYTSTSAQAQPSAQLRRTVLPVSSPCPWPSPASLSGVGLRFLRTPWTSAGGELCGMLLPSWLGSQILGQKPRTGEATALTKISYNLWSIHHAAGRIPGILFYLHNYISRCD